MATESWLWQSKVSIVAAAAAATTTTTFQSVKTVGPSDNVNIPLSVGGWWSLPCWRSSRNVHSQRETGTTRPSHGCACRLVGSYWPPSGGRWVLPAASNPSTRPSGLDSKLTASHRHTDMHTPLHHLSCDYNCDSTTIWLRYDDATTHSTTTMRRGIVVS